MRLSDLGKVSSTTVEAGLLETLFSKLIRKQLAPVISNITKIAETLASLELKHGVDGKDGINGINGKDGLNGKDGKDGVQGQKGDKGQDGKQGKDGQVGKDGSVGISVVSAEVTFDNHLVLTLSDGNEIDAGQINIENKTNYITQVKGEDVVSYSTRYDQVSTTLAYKGEAIIGASESAPLWRIQKLVYGVDGDVTITWATGTTDFRFNWTDRATLTYI